MGSTEFRTQIFADARRFQNQLNSIAFDEKKLITLADFAVLLLQPPGGPGMIYP